MAREIIVVTAAYGNDHVRSLGGQAVVLPSIADAGADGAETRRELCSAEGLNALPSLVATIERHGLLACYSAPQALFVDNGELNPELLVLLAETQTLNALWLKFFPGHFLHSQQPDGLREIFHDSSMVLVVENDQTDCGRLAPMQRFKAACRVHQLSVTLTFDMGNWLRVGDSSEEAACHLAPAVNYTRVKAVEPHHEKFRAVPPDQAADRQLALLDNPPVDALRGIEFPLTDYGLTAVTRRYANLLHED